MNKNLQIIIVVLLIAVHFGLGISAIGRMSPTYDEPLHLAAGYSYLSGHKYYLNIYDHPPLAEMIAAAPLLFMSPVVQTQHPSWAAYQQYSFADYFLYHNRVDAEKMLNAGRVMILCLSCMLAFLVFLWAKQLFGVFPGLAALFVYCFTSACIANGTLATTDMAVTLFMFAGMYAFWRWWKNPSTANVLLMALASGLALASKFSAVVLLGFFGAVLLYLFLNKRLAVPQGKLIAQAALFIAAVFCVLLVIYRFDSLGLFFEGFQRTMTRLDKGRSAFLAGHYSTAGWKYYFLFTLFTKTSLPSLVLMVSSLFFVRKSFKDGTALFLWFPVLAYFAIASLSKVQIGHRHILPIYPFLIVLGSQAAGLIGSAGKKKYAVAAVLGGLLAWHAGSCLKIHPWHLSYFNEAIGDGSRALTDSNIDWGQGLKEMGKWCRRTSPGTVYFDYFGTGDPHYYGIKYYPIGFINNLQPDERRGDGAIPAGARTFFAVSVTNLRATYYARKDIFSWLDELRPDAIIAKSIFIYDLTDNPAALQKLNNIIHG